MNKLAIVLTASVGFALISCTRDDPKPGSLPPDTTPLTEPPSDRSVTPDAGSSNGDGSVRDLLSREYPEFVNSYYLAQYKSVGEQRGFLARWETDPLLSKDLTGLEQAREQHIRYVGTPMTHIIKITVVGNKAIVHDCLDTSSVHRQDSRTGRTIAGSTGAPASRVITKYKETNDGWRAYESSGSQKTCSNGTEASPSVDGSS